MIMRRLVIAVAVPIVALLAVLTSALLLPSTTAGASGNLGWRLTAWGSADCNQDGAHNVCFRYPPGGGDAAVAFDSWVPDWCYIVWISDGDAAGTPESIMWVSSDPGRQCVPWGGGWGDGSGYQAGVMGAGWPVEVTAYRVAFRDPNDPWSTGTLWRIW